MTLFNIGPVMWRCANGAPNYRKSWWVRFINHKASVAYSLPIHPSIIVTPWHRGTLSLVQSLGQSSGSISFGIEFWRWYVGIMIGRTDNTMTTEEIDEYRSKNAMVIDGSCRFKGI